MRGMLTRFALVSGVALAVAACQGIGDGNTISKLEIIPATSATSAYKYETGGTYRLYQCLRDELLLQATFDSGSVSNFNSRATWSSSDESVVKVSNRDIPLVTVSNGAFSEIATQPYSSGTVEPVGEPGQSAVITAKFAGLSASINVVIRKPVLKLVPVPYSPTENPMDFSGPASLGERTTKRLALIGIFDGRVSTSIGSAFLNTIINPVLWKFPDGAYVPTDEDAATTFDNLWVMPADTPNATLSSGGTVRGLSPSGGEYNVEASLSLCPDTTDPDLKPVTTVQVLSFATTTPPLTVGYESGFHADGGFAPLSQFVDGDIVIGSNQVLTVTGHLDSTGDGAGDIEQNLGQQIRYNFEPRDVACDGKGLNCTANSLFSIQSNDLTITALSGSTGRLNDGFDLICITDPTNDECDESVDTVDLVADTTPDPVNLEACFPLCQPRLASLAITGVVGSTVSLEATPIGLSGTPHYVFDCGDSSALHDTGSTATTDCVYASATGLYTATVRVLDDDAAASVNAGAVQVAFDAPGANTAPTATLQVTPATATAPALVFFSTLASDADTGDSIKVYEFTPEPGVTIRQSSSTLTWLYLQQPASPPSVVVYDSLNTPSTASTATLTVTGTSPAPYRSAAKSFVAIPATPCEVKIVPPASDTPTEVAFTFPGLIFEAIASFIATKDDATQVCGSDPLIGTQNATRLMAWAARPTAESEEFSEYVTIRVGTSDFQRTGQAIYLANPPEDTIVSIVATPGSATLLKDLTAPTPSTLTVQPCPPGTCPTDTPP